MATWTGFSSIDDNKKTCKLYDIDLIKQDILNQFMCPIGSRWRLPNWGCIAWSMLYEPLNDSNIEDIKNDCIRIVQSDSRLSIIDCNVTSDSKHSIIISLDILYVPTNMKFDMYITYNDSLTENQ